MPRRKRTTTADRRQQRHSQPRADATERRAAGSVSQWDGTLHMFEVQKPLCAPCRDRVYSALYQFAVPVFRYEEWIARMSIQEAATLWKIELKTLENLKYGPVAVAFIGTSQCARFYVPNTQARWAYRLLRSNLLAVTAGTRDTQTGQDWRNDAYGELPRAWNANEAIRHAVNRELIPPGAGQAWVESTCTEDKEVWEQIRAYREKQEKNRK